jgi:hypothetical protein
MSITLEWGNQEQSIIHVILKCNWTWEEYDTAVNTIHILLSDTLSSVDLVIDFRESDIPGSAIKHIEDGELFFWHPRTSYTALIGIKGFLRTLLISYVQTYPDRTQQLLFADTIEAAHILLARYRKQQLASLRVSSYLEISRTLLS